MSDHLDYDQRTWWQRWGHRTVTVRSECGDEVTLDVEHLYSAFKSRLMAELVADNDESVRSYLPLVDKEQL